MALSQSSSLHHNHHHHHHQPTFAFSHEQVCCLCEVLLQTGDVNHLSKFLKSLPVAMLSDGQAVLRARATVAFEHAQYQQVYDILENHDFDQQYHTQLQSMWYQSHYREEEIKATKASDNGIIRKLGAVKKYRLRKKFSLPRTIWDGEEESYCIKRKSRTGLMEFYEQNCYPTRDQKSTLALLTNLTIIQVSNWFKNRRQRDKNPQTRKERGTNTRTNNNNKSLSSLVNELKLTYDPKVEEKHHHETPPSPPPTHPMKSEPVTMLPTQHAYSYSAYDMLAINTLQDAFVQS